LVVGETPLPRPMSDAAEPDARDFKRLHLSHGNVWFIFVVYVALLLGGVSLAAYGIMTFDTASHPEPLALLSGLAMSLSGSAVFYIRKLYRACINDTYTFAVSGAGGDRIKRTGTIVFFLSRPLFGVGFSILLYSLWRLSITATETPDVQPGPGFIYFAIALGFLSGFLAGRVLTILEGYGTRRIGSIFGGDA